MELIEQIQVGDKVRSYDFDYNTDCYVEGDVLQVGVMYEGCPRYEIFVTRQVVCGKEKPNLLKGHRVYPPINGTRRVLGGICNGVKTLKT